MLIEFALHVMPPLRSFVEVNANLVWERLVDYSAGRVCYGLGHIVGFHKGCVRTTRRYVGFQRGGIDCNRPAFEVVRG